MNLVSSIILDLLGTTRTLMDLSSRWFEQSITFECYCLSRVVHLIKLSNRFCFDVSRNKDYGIMISLDVANDKVTDDRILKKGFAMASITMVKIVKASF